MKTNSYNRGMTLIEIAIVLVVIGIMLSIGISMVGPLTKRAKLIETRDTINADVESVTGYATTNQKVPDNITVFQSTVKNPKDAWTKSIYYFFDTFLTQAGSVCSRQTTNLTICREATCTNTIPNVAFIAISGAENYNPQTGKITTGCPAGQTCIGVYDDGTANIDNCTTTTNCPDTNFPSTEDRINSPTDSYDDVVKWVTLSELQTKTGCMSTQSQLRITNESLPQNYVCNAYPTTSVYAEGGVPFGVTNQNYRWCIENTTGTAPANLSFRNTADTANITFSTNCLGLTETSWTQSSTVLIRGTPNQAGGFYLTFYVRDNNDSARHDIIPTGDSDNYKSKNLLLTINPPLEKCPDSGTGTCLTGCSVTFSNTSGATVRIVGGNRSCVAVTNSTTSVVSGLDACDTINVYRNVVGCAVTNLYTSIRFPGPINSGGTVTYGPSGSVTCPP